MAEVDTGSMRLEFPMSEGCGREPRLTPLKEKNGTAAAIESKLEAAATAREAELASRAEKARKLAGVEDVKAKRDEALENIAEGLSKFAERERSAQEKADALRAAEVARVSERNRAVAEAVAKTSELEKSQIEAATEKRVAREREAASRAAQALESRRESAMEHNKAVAEAVERASQSTREQAAEVLKKLERAEEARRKAAAHLEARKASASAYNEKVAQAVAQTLSARQAKAEERQAQIEQLSSPFAREAEDIPDERKPAVMRRLEDDAERRSEVAFSPDKIDTALKAAELKREQYLAENRVVPNAERSRRAKEACEAVQAEAKARAQEIARTSEERLEAAARRREESLRQRKEQRSPGKHRRSSHPSCPVENRALPVTVASGVAAVAFVVGVAYHLLRP